MKHSRCFVCWEDDVVFQCRTKRCNYELCATCVKLAMEDESGSNCLVCPMCKAPTALDMVKSVCGPGAIREVERDLRGRVEHEVRKENEKRQEGKKLMDTYEARASSMFGIVAEELYLRCPRCSLVFHDYEGCNALTCGNISCGAKFCAICLKDCGADAHNHARTHGNLFDKQLFEKARETREQEVLNNFLNKYPDEPFEVKELVRIKVETLGSPTSNKRNRGSVSRFLASAKASLRAAVQNDRLSVLNDHDDPRRGRRLTLEDVSPRNAIPENYKLSLFNSGKSGSICCISLQQNVNDRWVKISLPDDNTKDTKEQLVIDSLTNIRHGLKCCSILFEGARDLYQTSFVNPPKGSNIMDDEVSVMFSRIDSRTGELIGEPLCLCNIGYDGTTILGFNQNGRMSLLEKHVQSSSDVELMFEPLREYVGESKPRRLLQQLSVPVPDTCGELNNRQKLLAHPLSIRTAMEAAGPPGTGQTKVITELVRSVLFCTDHHVIILSERNGAVDAIAEKMASDCIKSPRTSGQLVKDFGLWRKILAYGSSDMGESSRLFSLEQKLEMHPEIIEAERVVQDKEKALKTLKKNMLKTLADEIRKLQVELRDGSNAVTRSTLIERNGELGEPLLIRESVTNALKDVENLVQSRDMEESEVEAIVRIHSSILRDLVPIFDESTKGTKLPPWPRRMMHTHKALKAISKSLKFVLHEPPFLRDTIEQTVGEYRKSEETLKQTVSRVKVELVRGARVMMATIGSSHKLPLASQEKVGEEEDGDSLVDALERLDIESYDNDRETIIVFDEAGCIPDYELLGLSRLGRNIKALICVGDSKQLHPYSPGTKSSSNRDFRGRRAHREVKVESLLDVSRLIDDCASGDVPSGGKVRLNTQYRVPRDIASILNDRIYNGQYQTAAHCSAPERGFNLVHVDFDYRSKKYENENEVRKCLELVSRAIATGEGKSIMVLTPYKKQQRRLQYAFKQEGLDKAFPILTIDQCQGQEADLVYLSLVQRPTRFLNKNRFNVALSRVRQQFYLLTDRQDFETASRNHAWECDLLARDLLHSAPSHKSFSHYKNYESDSEDSMNNFFPY